MAARPVSPEDKRLLALYVCAFAILQPDEAPLIRDTVVEQDSSYLEFFSGSYREELAEDSGLSDESAIVNPKALDACTTLSEEPPAQPAEGTVPSPQGTRYPDAATVLSWLEAQGDWASVLTMAQLQSAVRVLKSRTRDCSVLLQDIEKARNDFVEFLEKVNKSGWIGDRISVANPLAAPKHITASEGLAEARRSRDVLRRLLDAIDKVDVLATRLGREPEPVLSKAVGELAAAEIALNSKAKELGARLEELSQVKKEVGGFLAQLTDTDEEGSVRCVKEAPASCLKSLAYVVSGRCGPVDTEPQYAPLSNNITLLGPIFACFIQRYPEEGAECIASYLTGGGRRHPSGDIEALRFLSLDHIQQIASSHKECSPLLAQLLLASALGSGNPEKTDYLAAIVYPENMPPVCYRFYQALINASRRQPQFDLRAAVASDSSLLATAGSQAERQRVLVLEMILQSPGMRGLYHKLRLIAHVQFVEPLKDYVQSKSCQEAIAKWADFGAIDEMVGACARAAGERRLEDRHRLQTQRYLRVFDRELRKWHGLCVRRKIERDPQVARAYEGLRTEAAKDASSASASLMGVIDAVREETPESLLLRSALGDICSPDGQVVLSHPILASLVSPTMVLSWAQFVSDGVVDLPVFLSDLLRSALGIAPKNLPAAVEELLRRGQIAAALAAAEKDESLLRDVKGRIDSNIAALKRANRDLLEDAERARFNDEYIDLCLVECEHSVATYDVAAAEQRLVELEELLVRYRVQADPARRPLVEFLRRANQPLDEETSLRDLEEYVELVRQDNTHRRRHVLAFESVKDDESFPPFLKANWPSFANRIDRPDLWPDATVSDQLAGLIRTFAKFAKGRFRYRDSDPERIDTIIETLGEWLPNRLAAVLEEKTEVPSDLLERLLEYQKEVEEYCPDARILQMIGAATTAKPVTREEGTVSVEPKGVLRSELPKTEIDRVWKEPSKILRDMREWIRGTAAHEGTASAANAEQLKKACARGDWGGARTTAAGLLGKSEHAGSLVDVEVVYAVALAMSSADLPMEEQLTALENACLAVAIGGEDTGYYLESSIRDQFPARVLVAVLADEIPRGLHVQPDAGKVGDVLRTVESMTKNERVYQWLAELFWKASKLPCSDGHSNASARIAASIWNSLSDHRASADYRSHLLCILFRLKCMEAIRHLAAQSSKPLDNLITLCLSAFQAAEANLTARPSALQFSAAIRQQSRGKSNTKPWVLLFNRLEASQVATNISPLRPDAEAYVIGTDASGGLIVEVRLVPSPLDPPKALYLEVGDLSQTQSSGQIMLATDDDFYTERTIPVTIPSSLVPPGGSEWRLPYRIYGTTIHGNPIDVRDTWYVSSPRSTGLDVGDHSLRIFWPGANGDPVATAKGFYGREHEMMEIDAQINDPVRPRSIMVFGQRRIGKTSLLREMVRSHPLERGKCCAAFVDVSGLEIPKEEGAISKALTYEIADSLVSDERNPHIAHHLKERWGKDIGRLLTKGMDGNANLATGLEQIVARLRERTDCEFSSLAIFIDEFDRFVAPWVQGRRDEVNRLMWTIRQVVQRSDRISLVLAGSGLQRLLKENYQDALYESIKELQLRGFHWDTDREAVMKTFIPPGIRAQICGGRDLEDIAKYACELCGGHPWFLSMLGCAAAVLLKGRRLSRQFLNHVVETVMNEQVRAAHAEIWAGRFYKEAVFESLGIVGTRPSALAKSILACIGEMSTTDMPWVPTRYVLEQPELLRLTTDRDIIGTLNMLESVGVLDRDREQGRVKIRVPVTASALRQDAPKIREEARDELRSLSGDDRQ